MSIYYNEFDPYKAKWLKNLMKRGFIPEGHVDKRDIRDVQPADLTAFSQCHFFAGLGGWAYALELSAFEGPVWTGSLPCQPFSKVGKGQGFNDKRHLWADFYRLIQECKPPTIFGEQVSSPAGRLWLNAVRLDLEKVGYGVGAADLCAAGLGFPHIRQRLYWVGDANPQRFQACELKALEGQRRGKERRAVIKPSSTFIRCSDGKDRPIEPGICPLVDGLPNRVQQLCAYGNAIVPQVAMEFINGFIDYPR